MMAGYTAIDIWLDDTDEYSHTATPTAATVTRSRDFSIHSRSLAALRELSDYLRMAADELDQQRRREQVQ